MTRRDVIASATAALLTAGSLPAAELPTAATAASPGDALVDAVHSGSIKEVERLLAGKADPRLPNRFGVTPLFAAASVGNAAIIERLLAAGAPASQPGTEGATPLMMAARAGSTESVRLLMKHGADPNAAESWKGQTALMWAAALNHSGIVAALLAAGANPDARSTVWPVRPKKKEGGNLVSTPPRGGLTPLLFAARQGSAESARLLVKAGANLNLADPDNIPPVTLALINAHYDLAAFLVESGADVKLADKWGRTPLYAAIDMFSLEPSGVRPAPQTTDRSTGLDIARLLLARGANPNAALTEPTPGRGVSDFPDQLLRAGTTPLIRAAKTGDVAGLKLLVSNGADPRAKTSHGVTALMAAAGQGWRFGDSVVPEADSLAAVKYCLEELGLDPNQPNEKGRTALHGAAERGANSIVEFLVARGARLDIKDAAGLTPLDVAKGTGYRGNPEYPETVALFKRLAAAR